MTNPLPDEGEWLLSASAGQPLPPFVKLMVYFDLNCGFCQGINLSQVGSLSKITRTGPNKFGAFFDYNNAKGQFDATLGDDGTLTMEFLTPQRSTQIAKPIFLNRDAVVQQRGVAAAKRMVAQFSARTDRGAFPNIPRQAVVDSLLTRIDKPEAIYQGMTYTCGPAAFMFAFAKHDIAAYAKFVIDLYENGVATVGTLRVEPSSSFRFDKMSPLVAAAADWIALGSLRDSSNWFFQYHTNELPFVNARTTSENSWLTWEDTRGSTTAGEIKSWFTEMGFTEVVNDTSALTTSSLENLQEADRRYRNGEKVCLRICSNLISANNREQSAAGGGGDHFIVLASPVEIAATVQFRFFTWGEFRRLPFRLKPEEFLKSYYGFVAARR